MTQECSSAGAASKRSVARKRTHTSSSSATTRNKEHVRRREKRTLFTIVIFIVRLSNVKFFTFPEQIVSKSNVERNDASPSLVETLDDESLENDSKLKSTDSDISIVLKKTRLSRMHEETNDKDDMHFNDSIESVLHKCKQADTSTNAVSKTPKEKDVRVGREKPSKTKHHKRDVIDLT